MLSIYKRFWQVNWAENWQYRANFMMYLAYWLVSPVIYLSVWTTIAKSQGSVNGMTPNDFVTYYLALLVIDQFTSDTTIYFFAYKIQDGTLSAELLRPVHPILTNALMNNIAFKALMLTVFWPIWLGLCLLFQPDFSAVTLQSVLLTIPAVILGFAINFLLGAALTSLAFWTTRVYSIMEFFGAMAVLFGGQFVPLTLMPPLIQQIAKFLPFQFYLYFPISLLLNQLPPEVIQRNFLWGGIWLLIALASFLLIWRAGVKRFSAVGA